MVTTFPSQSYLSPYTVPFAVQPVGSIPHRPSAVTQTLSHNCPMYSYPAPRQPVGPVPHCPAPLPSVVRPLSLTENRPAFPNPTLGQFLIYVLQFCLAQTSVCFSCGNTLRQEGVPAAPNDPVIVSKMVRERSYQGTAQSKLANVYFHCKVSCVKRKKPDFEGHLCTVPAQNGAHLQKPHRQYLRNHFGL